MREIKLRAWDVKRKIIIEWSDLQLRETLGLMFESRLVEMMQYTGLKDKNGKEIYEGDILKINNDLVFVDWNELEAQWDLMLPETEEYDESAYEDEVGLRNHIEFEVIGNIYEDKQLMK